MFSINNINILDYCCRIKKIIATTPVGDFKINAVLFNVNSQQLKIN